MRNAIKAPLLSGLIMPGLGQLANLQVAKGGIMVAGASFLFMALLGLTFYHVSKAVVKIGELAPGADKWAALRAQLLKQDTTWLWVIGILLAGMWIFGIVDAYRFGRARDRQTTRDK